MRFVQFEVNRADDDCGDLHVHLWALGDDGVIYAFLCFDGEILAVVPATELN